MSEVMRSRCRDDMSGKGAELSSPKMDLMSWRMYSTPSCGSDVCSRKRAGMLFWPRYRDTSAESPSTARTSQRHQHDDERGVAMSRSLTVRLDGSSLSARTRTRAGVVMLVGRVVTLLGQDAV